MKLGHLHIGFKDLNGAVRWMKTTIGKDVSYENTNMAVFAFGDTSLIFDQSDEDTPITIAFESDDCEKDFKTFIKKGATEVESPKEQSWGVKTAYVKGPGKTTVEIEQVLK